MFVCIEEELEALPKAQVIIVGDLNCGVVSLPTLQRLIDSGFLIDLGAHPRMFGHEAELGTCKPHNSIHSFRRDYVLVSAELLPFVSSFQVEQDPVIPVHSVLKCCLTVPGEAPSKTSLKTPASLYGQFTQLVNHQHQRLVELSDGNTKPMKYKDLWDQLLGDLHQCMDDSLTTNDNMMQKAHDNRSTDD
eukprot:5482250-Karenia_brevis.AAC.1